MKRHLLLLMAAASLFSAYLMSACQHSVDSAMWKNEIKPEMQAHRAWLETLNSLKDYKVTKHSDLFDQHPREHHLEAIKFLQTYVADSLGSYQHVSNLYGILSAMDKAGKLYVENSDDTQQQLAGAFANALFGEAFGNVYGNFTKTYVLRIAEYLQQHFNKITVELDTPEFVKKTKDRVTYSVHCPTYDEDFTLSINRKTKEYSWDLTDTK